MISIQVLLTALLIPTPTLEELVLTLRERGLKNGVLTRSAMLVSAHLS